MKGLGQGQRIFWLVRGLTVMGLATVVVTLAVLGWKLHRIRGSIAAATDEQQRLNKESDQLRHLAAASRSEILSLLDDALVADDDQSAVTDFTAFVHSQQKTNADPTTTFSLKDLGGRLTALGDLSRRTASWHARYNIVWGDLRHQVTIGKARALTAQVRDAVESLEGRRRINQAIQHKRWHRAAPEEASAQARQILTQEEQRETRGNLSEFKNQLAEFARLVELLGGEEQFDDLADLKDNQIKPVLDRMSRSLSTFGADELAGSTLTPQSVEDLKTAIFGTRYVSDASHQNLQVGQGGLFALRRDALELRREGDQLKSQLSDLFQGIEIATNEFDKSTQLRTVALTGEMEQSLSSTWWQMIALGSACGLVFLWLSRLIWREINAQIWLIEQGRLIAEEGRLTTQQLMLQQQADAVELADVHKQLVETSRQAGMAEVATGVLHNVGNVLNSVNVSANLIGDKIQRLPVANLVKASAMMESHRADLGAFLTADEKGRQLPGYFSMVSKLLADENTALMSELSNLTHGIEHIKQVVQLQQDHAKSSTFREKLNPATLIDDALRINLISLERHQIEIVREVTEVGIISLDKHKTLQILINLISNAKNAVKMVQAARPRVITVRLRPADAGGVRVVRFQVADTGMGILPENMSRIFTHGFTTRATGHGFGLHTAANSATEMGGSLSVASQGPDRGATFTLDIPIAANEVAVP